MTKRPWALGIGIVAMIGIALWMRELASWRPKLVGKVGFQARQMSVSRDGRFLWTDGYKFLDNKSVEKTFALQPLTPNVHSERLSTDGKAFHVNHGIETFPRLWRDHKEQKVYFVYRAGEKTVVLPTTWIDYGAYGDYGGSGSWSLERREIFNEFEGEVFVWNMSDGRLKRRFSVGNPFDTGEISSVFSPDGKWLLLAQVEDNGHRTRLRRYDVQSGKQMLSPNIFGVLRDIGPLRFSPDGKYLLVSGGWGDRAIVLDTSEWKQLWSDDASLSATWSPDNRVGLAKTDKFEWRDPVSGKILQSLPGPAKGTGRLTTSPDGNWIYASNDKLQILRWRAR